jgi:hypothetical protein
MIDVETRVRKTEVQPVSERRLVQGFNTIWKTSGISVAGGLLGLRRSAPLRLPPCQSLQL